MRNRQAGVPAVSGTTILLAILLWVTGIAMAQNGPAISGGLDPIYAVSEISVHPEPPEDGNPTVLCVDCFNPTPYSQPVLLEFSVGPLGIGIPFEPVGETEVTIPAGGGVTGFLRISKKAQDL